MTREHAPKQRSARHERACVSAHLALRRSAPRSSPRAQEDFLFVVAAPLNGDTAPGALSFLASHFPDHAL